MNLRLLSLAAAALATPALCQTESLYRIDRPSTILHGWGNTLEAMPDLDGDGVPELLVGVFGHGGGEIATLHSGATGAHLFTLTAPFEALFYGFGFAAIGDTSGDGVPELVAIGTQSGAWNSFEGRLRIHSGADGALLNDFVVPAGVPLSGFADATAVADVDGDGVEDVLCKTSQSSHGSTWTLFSTQTGLPLYHADASGEVAYFLSGLDLVSDVDGDGAADFAAPARSDGANVLEVRSSATGALLQSFATKGASFLTANLEPFLSVADLDGDGLRDLATGGVFTAYVEVVSSADGQALARFDCTNGVDPCVGSRLVEVADFSGDGHPDLLALETNVFGNDGLSLFGLDPVTGATVFEQFLAPLGGGYSSASRVTRIDGADPQGFATFALFEDSFDQVVVRRVLPPVGQSGCASTPNSTGEPATITARGSASLTDASLSLELANAPAGESAYFLHGPQAVQLPLGSGFLCVAGGVGRLPAGQTNAAGLATLQVDLAALGVPAASSVTFQAIFRDADVGGLQTSDSVTVTAQP